MHGLFWHSSYCVIKSKANKYIGSGISSSKTGGVIQSEMVISFIKAADLDASYM